ncbi:tyrosine-type recombinase/integrase [Vibrio kyushuensis]|uniref:tyrosine-type recombinase/integrase n=1 Tax=Vibrio kyushuensis TaxID=2910249 RepID=UPI003D0F5D94
MSTLQEWIIKLSRTLSDTSTSEYQDALVSVCYRIYDSHPQLFSSHRIARKTYFKEISKPLARLAETADELQATTQVLEQLYHHHNQFNPELIAPKVLMPLRDEKPILHDNTPPLAVIEHLAYVLSYFHPTSNRLKFAGFDVQKASLGHAILTVANKANITNLSALNELIKLPMEKWQIINGSTSVASAFIETTNQRVYLVDEAILAMQRIHLEAHGVSDKKCQSLIRDAIVEWRTFAINTSSSPQQENLQMLSVDKVIKYLSFLNRSCGLDEQWNKHIATQNHTFLRCFAGHNEPHKQKNKEWKTIESSTEFIWEPVANHSIKHDEPNHEKLKSILAHFKEQSQSEDRRSKDYKIAKKEMLALVNSKYCWSDALVINWITSLFIFGSPWKDKLAVSTLLSYYSTILRFVQAAWLDPEILAIPLTQFHTQCQIGINQIKNSEEQRTVIRFLSFCLQYPKFRQIDVDGFDLLSYQGIARAHYIPPAMFDDICYRFYPTDSTSTLPIVIIMQLCYYAGLREDEALSLLINDIDFNTGFIYITDGKKRKSINAVRKVPLALLPEQILNNLVTYTNEQHRAAWSSGSNNLFDSTHYARLENEFIQFMRKELNDDTLVTHSLRHCAANNWVYLLAIIAFEPKQIPKLYFNQHSLFSPEQQARIKLAFELCGQTLSPYFPIIDWVSEKLGHASAATTLGNYIHLLDWISLIINYSKTPITKSAIRYWCANSNYGFTRQKQFLTDIDEKSKSGVIDSEYLRVWLSRHWQQAKHHPTLFPSNPNQITQSNGTLFTQFTREIEKQAKGVADECCNEEILKWLKNINNPPTVFVPEANQVTPWLKLSLSANSWVSLSKSELVKQKHRVLKYLKLKRTKDKTSTYRDLHTALQIYKMLNLAPFTIRIESSSECRALISWKALLERFDINPYVVDGTGKTNALLRPYRLYWPLWNDIDAILLQFANYLDFLVATYEEKP